MYIKNHFLISPWFEVNYEGRREVGDILSLTVKLINDMLENSLFLR